MVGMGGGRIHISSWGWTDGDGRTEKVTPDSAVFRLWSVTLDDERVGMLLMPVGTQTTDVFLAACRAFDPDD